MKSSDNIDALRSKIMNIFRNEVNEEQFHNILDNYITNDSENSMRDYIQAMARCRDGLQTLIDQQGNSVDNLVVSFDFICAAQKVVTMLENEILQMQMIIASKNNFYSEVM